MKQLILRVQRILLAAIVATTQLEAGPPDPDYHLYIEGGVGVSGDSLEVGVFLDFPLGVRVAGMSWGVCASPGDDSLAVVPCGGGLPNGCASGGFIRAGAAVLPMV